MAADPGDPRLLPFWFDLPDAQIARFPAPTRDGSRLLDLTGDTPVDDTFRSLPTLVRPGDLLVLNDVRVFPARLRAHRSTGGPVEVLLVRPVGDGWDALARPGRRLRVGERLVCGEGEVVLSARHDDGSWRVQVLPEVDTVTRTGGEVPLPPYLRRAVEEEDRARYQTVYARGGEFRAAAAPTAGLHFTPELLAAVARAGARTVPVTLEVGAGTFRPIDGATLDRGRLHPERYDVPAATWAALTDTRRAGGRVIAVGTTVIRVLESATGPGPGETDLFVREGHVFGAVDLLLTNFHLPASSLLMLVCAFGGRERVMRAYHHAVAAGYRFYSYGDAMLVARPPAHRGAPTEADRNWHASPSRAG